ncbi:hypothetical protein [Ornithinimicrobium cerasi]|uniref:hypothetical protein n=1 Tax=Ornithinimicrobium cerasi TaxID=2248773 RepID=UPI000EFDE744|nr:hypothetical protein [Ornithinimicrobium cerasi]
MVLDTRGLRWWTLTLLVVTGLLAAASVLLHLRVRGTAANDLFSYFHLGSEVGLSAYWNALLLGLVAACALFSGFVTRARSRRWGWFVVAAVTLFLSLDEATRLHERTAALVTTNPLPTYTWVVAGIPLAALMVGVLWFATRSLPTVLRRRLGIALAVYIVGALGFEALSGVAWRQQRPDLSEALGTVEEVLEMVACVYAVHVLVQSWLPLRLEVRSTPAGVSDRV